MSMSGSGEQQQSAPGTVWLVGAGPGDPDLITVRGLKALRAADAVVCDRLIPSALLAECRPNAERYDAGKTPHGPTMPQAEINALLIRLAREGKHVVRLKGGDPFVFGRGGEEALALVAAGVPVQVVPGISAAIAAPSAAGIPVTHRGVASSFAVFTGHDGLEREGVAGADTLVVLMGVERLADLTARLIALGRDPHEPAALVHAATTPAQRTIIGTLAGIAATAREAGITPPATLVIGPTVALHDQIGRPERV
jgi:uroporphyrin-III C-methyltransferase